MPLTEDFIWTPCDLIQRFGLQHGTAQQVREFGLRVLEQTTQGFKLREYDQRVLIELSRTKAQFFVPAGWAKKVLWALYNYGRRLEIKDGALVVCSENGEGIYYF